MNENVKGKIEILQKKRKWYQSVEIGDVRTIPESDLRAMIRTDSVLKFIPQLLDFDDRVLDIGCNAGLHSLTAAQYCIMVVGVDVSKEFIEQAEFLKSFWEKENKKVSNVSFKVCDILEALDIINNFDVIFMLKVLYHPGFVEGIHDFMAVIEKSNIRAIFTQGHVTYPKYGTIRSMTELFDQYGFNTLVLENIPEYPILLATRKGLEVSPKIKPIKEVTRHIEYYPDYGIEDNSRCKVLITNLDEKRVDFDEYREVFERCFIEVGIMRGTLGSVRPVSLSPDPIEDTEFAKKMGVNIHSNARIKSAREFFDLYEKYGEKEFLDRKLYSQTEYWNSISRPRKETLRSKLKRVLLPGSSEEKRVKPYLQMYKNMKVIENLVPKSRSKKVQYSVWHPDDFPWSINYFGYIKKRDGSHRRMIMSYFGSKSVDEIVVDFDKITVNDLEGSIDYLKKNFEWFYNEVLNASKK